MKTYLATVKGAASRKEATERLTGMIMRAEQYAPIDERYVRQPFAYKNRFGGVSWAAQVLVRLPNGVTNLHLGADQLMQITSLQSATQAVYLPPLNG